LDDYTIGIGLEGSVIYTVPQFTVEYSFPQVVVTKSALELALEVLDQSGFVAQPETSPWTGSWPSGLNGPTAVPDFISGALNIWYHDYDVWLTIRECFISTPELTQLWDDALNVYDAGDYELFMQMHSQIAQYMPDQFGPCMEYPQIAAPIN
jgi:hypothetical protein